MEKIFHLVNDRTQLKNTGWLCEELAEAQDIIESIESDVQPWANKYLLETAPPITVTEKLHVPEDTPLILCTNILKEGLLIIPNALSPIEQNTVQENYESDLYVWSSGSASFAVR